MKAQYGILRFAKYKGPEIGHIEAHNERTKEKYASNPDVDTSRSQYNFHLITPQRKYRAEAEKQIAEAGCRTRSDSVRVVEALVTASPEFFKGKKRAEIKEYFIYAWISSRSIRQKNDHFRSRSHGRENTAYAPLLRTIDGRRTVIRKRYRRQPEEADLVAGRVLEAHGQEVSGTGTRRKCKRDRQRAHPAKLHKEAVHLNSLRIRSWSFFPAQIR